MWKKGATHHTLAVCLPVKINLQWWSGSSLWTNSTGLTLAVGGRLTSGPRRESQSYMHRAGLLKAVVSARWCCFALLKDCGSSPSPCAVDYKQLWNFPGVGSQGQHCERLKTEVVSLLLFFTRESQQEGGKKTEKKDILKEELKQPSLLNRKDLHWTAEEVKRRLAASSNAALGPHPRKVSQAFTPSSMMTGGDPHSFRHANDHQRPPRTAWGKPAQ